MVMCDYAYYDSKETLRQKIYCKHNGKICLYSKYCVKVGKFVPSEGMENCFMALNENKKIPNGARRVRFIKKGFLYIEMDNGVIKIKNDTINEADYVYVRKTNEEYEISLTPFVEEVIEPVVENVVDDIVLTDIDEETEKEIFDDDTKEESNEEDIIKDTSDEDKEEEEEEIEETVEESAPKKKRTYNKKRK